MVLLFVWVIIFPGWAHMHLQVWSTPRCKGYDSIYWGKKNYNKKSDLLFHMAALLVCTTAWIPRLPSDQRWHWERSSLRFRHSELLRSSWDKAFPLMTGTVVWFTSSTRSSISGWVWLNRDFQTEEEIGDAAAAAAAWYQQCSVLSQQDKKNRKINKNLTTKKH